MHRFGELVRRKEVIVTEMYLGDKDLFLEASKYQTGLTEISNEVQQLAFLNNALNKSKLPLLFQPQ